MTRVGVVGATGRMGREVCRAVAAAPDLELVAAVSRSAAGERLVEAIGVGGTELVLTDRLDVLAEVETEVLVDFTTARYAPEHIVWGIDHGIAVVVGTTGFALDDAWRKAPVGVIVAPNFAIGAVLLLRFAEQAAAHLAAAEVIESHHEGKIDAPSGTAIAIAERIAASRPEAGRGPAGDDAHPGARGADLNGVRVHSVRLPGIVARHEAVFGGHGQTLTIRHESTDRTSFMPGVLLAIRAVRSRPGLTVGLDDLLG